MKKILSCLIALGLVFSATAETVRLSDPVEVDETTETFGAMIDKLDEVKSLFQVLAKSENYINQEFAVEVEVKKVCQKKGCFFVAQEGSTTIRVAFKDYGFFVPTDIAGKKVTLIGQLKERELSVEEADHFSKDLGVEGAIQAGLMHEIVASAVRIPKS